jgi:hypothetical protein
MLQGCFPTLSAVRLGKGAECGCSLGTVISLLVPKRRLFLPFTSNTSGDLETPSPDVAVEAMALLLRIPEITSSNLGPETSYT